MSEGVDERELELDDEERGDCEEGGFGGNVELDGDIDEPIKKFYSILRS